MYIYVCVYCSIFLDSVSLLNPWKREPNPTHNPMGGFQTTQKPAWTQSGWFSFSSKPAQSGPWNNPSHNLSAIWFSWVVQGSTVFLLLAICSVMPIFEVKCLNI